VLYGLIGRLGGFLGENETRRARERKEGALRVGVRLRRELRVGVRVVRGL